MCTLDSSGTFFADDLCVPRGILCRIFLHGHEHPPSRCLPGCQTIEDDCKRRRRRLSATAELSNSGICNGVLGELAPAKKDYLGTFSGLVSAALLGERYRLSLNNYVLRPVLVSKYDVMRSVVNPARIRMDRTTVRKRTESPEPSPRRHSLRDPEVMDMEIEIVLGALNGNIGKSVSHLCRIGLHISSWALFPE